MAQDKHRRQGIVNKQVADTKRDIAEILVRSRDKIEAEIVSSANNGNIARSATHRERLFRDIEKRYQDMQTDVDKWSRSSTISVARKWRALAVDDLPASERVGNTWTKWSDKHLEDTIERFHPGNASRLAAVNAGKKNLKLGTKIAGMLEEDIRQLRKHVIGVNREAAVAGWTRKKVQTEIKKRVLTQSPAWQFIDRSGKRWKTKSYFSMLSKTLPANVSRSVYYDVATDSGHDLITIEGSPSTVGDDCDSWLGRIVSISGASRKYPSLDSVTSSSHVFGPNCNHYSAVVLPSDIDEATMFRKDAEKRIAEKKDREKEAEIEISRRRSRL